MSKPVFLIDVRPRSGANRTWKPLHLNTSRSACYDFIDDHLAADMPITRENAREYRIREVAAE